MAASAASTSHVRTHLQDSPLPPPQKKNLRARSHGRSEPCPPPPLLDFCAPPLLATPAVFFNSRHPISRHNRAATIPTLPGRGALSARLSSSPQQDLSAALRAPRAKSQTLRDPPAKAALRAHFLLRAQVAAPLAPRFVPTGCITLRIPRSLTPHPCHLPHWHLPIESSGRELLPRFLVSRPAQIVLLADM